MKTSLKPILKGQLARAVPPWLGVHLARIPFRFRLGASYEDHRRRIASVDPQTAEQAQFEDLKTLVTEAAHGVRFYRQFYGDHGFDPGQLRSPEDITKIPVVRKQDLKGWSLADRSLKGKRGIRTNTGGTSGRPLDLMLDEGAYSREWAHMHVIWERLGYRPRDLKLTVRGANLGNDPLRYNVIHNEFQVNAYCEGERVIQALSRAAQRYTFRYLHGYPSGLCEFSKLLQRSDPDLLEILRADVKGIFLGSEYPAPVYRETVETVWKAPSISWYGHTEMAVLACEREERFLYHPFPTYGLAEAVSMDGVVHLVGTTLHNHVSPLIRYDTEDLIEPVSTRGGLLESFRIAEGRIGDLVVDANGRSISLTALVFGRHHALFDRADFVQVRQPKPGALTVLVTTQDPQLPAADLFDTEGIHMQFTFELLSRPIKTPSGKVPLLVLDEPRG